MSLGDRMKLYEAKETGRRAMPLLPICVRIDGKRFSNFTRGLKRPFDPRLSEMMIAVTEALIDTTQARMGYTQSDEISLVFYSDSLESSIYLDGRIQKMTSILASMTTAHFHRLLPESLPEKSHLMPLFDARVWTEPTPAEAANAFRWRQFDARRNSISMAARAHFSHAQTMHKNSDELLEMLHQKGIVWDDYPNYFKWGTFLQKRRVTRAFTAEEIEKLPPQHQARTNPDLVVERNEIRRLHDLPPLHTLANCTDVILRGASPELRTPTENPSPTP